MQRDNLERVIPESGNANTEEEKLREKIAEMKEKYSQRAHEEKSPE